MRGAACARAAGPVERLGKRRWRRAVDAASASIAAACSAIGTIEP
jgi:hypothetical protein